MDHRAMSKAYKERRRIGAVYAITNTRNGKYITGHTADIASVRNRFQFAVTTGSAVDPRLRNDWEVFGPAAFSLDILEELERQPDQSQAGFLADLRTLEDLRRATLDPSNEY